MDQPPTSADTAKHAGKPRAIGPLATRLSRLLSQALASEMAPLGIAPAQFLVLQRLWKTDGLTQVDLAQRLGVEQATMANTLKRMVRDGLVCRAAHPDDARASLMRLTPKARDLEAEAKAAARGVADRAFGGLSRKEQKRFADMTRRVIAALEVDGTPSA